MLFLSMKLVYKRLKLIWLYTEKLRRLPQLSKNIKDTRLQITLCKQEIIWFPFIKKCLIKLHTFIIIFTLSFSCMFCLMNKVGREKHCVIINKSPRTSLNEQSAFSKVSEFKPKKIPWQKLHYMVIFFISGTTLSKFKGKWYFKTRKTGASSGCCTNWKKCVPPSIPW